MGLGLPANLPSTPVRALRLDVVVPVYNEIAVLPTLLPRLLTLRDQRDVELILVDGGSEDGTQEMLQKSGLPWMSAERGRSSQMNAGAGVGRGDVILFLHADSSLPDEACAEIRRAVANGAQSGFFRVRLDSARPLLRLVGWMINRRSRLTRVATGDQALFVTRATFEQLGGYAPLPLFEDVELCTRLRGLGPMAALPQIVTTSARRWENHGPWRTIFQMWLLRLGYAFGLSPERLARYYETAR